MSVDQTWVQPLSRPDSIDVLVKGTDRYNPSNVNVLTDYLFHQMATGEYDAMANLAILKLYQFNPEMMDTTIVMHILLQALVRPNGPDFNLCLSLLEGTNLSLLSSFLPTLTTLSSLLTSCDFSKFWVELAKIPRDDDEEAELGIAEGIDEHTTFYDSVRRAILANVVDAFSDISLGRLSTYLNLSSEETISYVEKLGWSVDGTNVKIQQHSEQQQPQPQIETTSKPTQIENIKLPQLQKFLTTASA